jgi:K+-sensing histidine kinase KdpD
MALSKKFLSFGNRVIKSTHSFRKSSVRARNLAKIVTTHVKMVDEYRKIMKRPRKIIITNNATNARVFADPIWLSRVVTNLFENADYATSGVKNPEINISFSNDTENFHIMIADNGAGMPPNVKAKILMGERITTKTDKPEDHGQGMEVVRRIVHMHDGKIEILENRPQGTIVKLSIPLK